MGRTTALPHSSGTGVDTSFKPTGRAARNLQGDMERIWNQRKLASLSSAGSWLNDKLLCLLWDCQSRRRAGELERIAWFSLTSEVSMGVGTGAHLLPGGFWRRADTRSARNNRTKWAGTRDEPALPSSVMEMFACAMVEENAAKGRSYLKSTLPQRGTLLRQENTTVIGWDGRKYSIRDRENFKRWAKTWITFVRELCSMEHQQKFLKTLPLNLTKVLVFGHLPQEGHRWPASINQGRIKMQSNEAKEIYIYIYLSFNLIFSTQTLE